jgi:putative ABC transport system permease protein
MSDFLQDVTFAWRNVLKKPATVLLIIITLALGIGVNTAMFSMAWHVQLAPLPYPDGERLVRLEQSGMATGVQDKWWSVPTFQDVSAQNTVFTDLLEYESPTYTLLGQGDPDLASTGVVNASYFSTLGIQAVLGRTFIADDEVPGAAPVILLGYDYWNSKFGASRDVVGRTLEMNGIAYTVVGVLADVPPYPGQNDVWVPTASDFIRSGPGTINNRNSRWMSHVIGRLRDDTTVQEAQRDLDTIADRLASAYPDTYASDYAISVKPLRQDMAGDSASTISLLSGLALLVILVACANVANLNLAMMAGRNQELAIREAVGASPARITRQLLTESVLQALVGGALGLLLILPCLSLLRAFASGFTALGGEIVLDRTVLIFALVMTLATGVLSGSAAAFSARNLNQALKEGGDRTASSRFGTRRRKVLMLVQFAVAFVMVSSAVLMLLSLYRLNNQDTGFDTDQVLAVSTEINYVHFVLGNQYTGEEPLRLLEQTRNLPGVEMAALQAGNPLLNGAIYNFQPEAVELAPGVFADPDARAAAFVNLATEDFFSVMSIQLLKGRDFAITDDAQSPQVAIVNAQFEQEYFPQGDVLGQRVKYGGKDATIVGVVSNIRATDLRMEEGPTVYFDYRQDPSSVINLYIKSAADLDTLGARITDLIHENDPVQSVGTIAPLNSIKAEWLAPAKVRTILVALFGVLALVLTLSGVVGVVAYAVSRRVREIGVHMAVGANPGNIQRMFVVQGLQTYVAGLLLGIVLMYVAAPAIEPLLYQTSIVALDVYLASTLLLTLAVLLAMYLPARRAGELSPAQALHND